MVVAMLVSCSFEPDYADTRYVCKLERCPDGYVCVDEVCLRGVPDAAIDDAAATDGAIDGAGAASCDDLFGTVPEYELCEESTATCTFGGLIEGTCDAMCAMFGSTCESARDSDEGAVCVELGEVGCDSMHGRAICTCLR
jgi:hypothetical protein